MRNEALYQRLNYILIINNSINRLLTFYAEKALEVAVAGGLNVIML